MPAFSDLMKIVSVPGRDPQYFRNSARALVCALRLHDHRHPPDNCHRVSGLDRDQARARQARLFPERLTFAQQSGENRARKVEATSPSIASPVTGSVLSYSENNMGQSGFAQARRGEPPHRIRRKI